MDIEPLLARLETLAPGFGRAQHDIEAMVSRGRSQDYKGVMQNCRLVLEALLRALVSDQLKQTPGKAMLDELITKFRQQANAGMIPTNVLAHMGTVQAWGNLSSHDHATKLSDDGVKVGKGEVVASLNSMVAILDWYSEAYGQPVAKPAPVEKPANLPPTISLRPPAGAAPAKKAPVIPIVAGVLVLAAGAGAFLATRPGPASIEPPAEKQPVPISFAALDALYRQWAEPLPPAACRSPSEAPVLGGHSSELLALEALPLNRSAEAWYLIARAQQDQKLDPLPALTRALDACPRFAAASNLAGKLAVIDKRLPDALASFQAALDSAPSFHKARFNLGLMHLQANRLSEAVKELKQITTADPKHGDAHFYLAVAYESQAQKDDAKAEFCAALANGRSDARDRCER